MSIERNFYLIGQRYLILLDNSSDYVAENLDLTCSYELAGSCKEAILLSTSQFLFSWPSTSLSASENGLMLLSTA